MLEAVGDFTCKEGPAIIAAPTLFEPSHQNKWKNTLFGKLHITKFKFIKPCHVIREIHRTWTDIAGISKFTIMELGNGMFSFHFEDEEDMEWIMDHRPWLITGDKYNKYNQYLLLLTEWRPNTPPSKIKFSDSHPFWVQVHDIPYEYVSKEMGRKIGEGTGHVVLDVDFDGTNTWSTKSLKIRILVDVTKKLSTGCWLLIDKNQPENVLWLPFKYDELPMFCYRCGIIGHSEDSCWDDLEENDATISYDPEGVDNESELPAVLSEGQVLRVEGKQGYGDWLYDEEDEDDEDESNDADYEGLSGLVDNWGFTDSDDESVGHQNAELLRDEGYTAAEGTTVSGSSIFAKRVIGCDEFDDDDLVLVDLDYLC